MTENNYDKLKDAICELVNIAEDATSREVFEILDNAGVDVYFTECGQAHIFVDGKPEEIIMNIARTAEKDKGGGVI